jgi:hypothetical protein
MDRTELPLEPHHLGVPPSLSKMISMTMSCSVQTTHLSCINTNTVSKQTKTRFHTTHVTYDFHRVGPKLFMSPWQVQCKPCTYLASRLALSPNRPNRAPPDPRHQGGVPSGASNIIFEPTVRSTQTVHQYCIKSSTISKRTKPSFHLRLVA